MLHIPKKVATAPKSSRFAITIKITNTNSSTARVFPRLSQSIAVQCQGSTPVELKSTVKHDPPPNPKIYFPVTPFTKR
jgi:hypothetical protein